MADHRYHRRTDPQLGDGLHPCRPPLYTATTRLLIDTEQSTPFQNRTVVAESQAENALVESQVEVLRSEDTARAVVEHLALARSAEFRGKLADEGNDLTIAAELLQRSIVIRRIGLSYIIEISVTSSALSALFWRRASRSFVAWVGHGRRRWGSGIV